MGYILQLVNINIITFNVGERYGSNKKILKKNDVKIHIIKTNYSFL